MQSTTVDTSKLGFIYTLSCPKSGLVRYVGQTTNVQKRFALHLFHSKNGRATTYKEKWINTLVNSGQKPVLEIVWEGSPSLLDRKEFEFIALYKAFGAKLTNATLGGTTTRGRVCSEETKRKLSEMFKGKCLRPPISDAERLAISIRQKGFKHTEESKRRVSESKKGKPSLWSTVEMPTEMKDKWHAKALALSKITIAIKDGVEYQYASRAEAARQLQCSPGDILKVINGKRNHCKGYTFKYASL